MGQDVVLPLGVEKRVRVSRCVWPQKGDHSWLVDEFGGVCERDVSGCFAQGF